MDKTRLIYIALSDEQIKKVKEENNLISRRMKITHAIVWEGHGQIFGEERLFSKHWCNWTQELTPSEKDKHISLREIFSECIKDDTYKFDSYEQKNFISEIVEIKNRLEEEFNQKKMNMIEEDYQKALKKVREESKNETPKSSINTKNIILLSVAVVSIVLVLLGVFNR